MTDTISIRKLRSDYGAHAPAILTDYLEPLPRARKAMTSFRVKKPLPSKDEFAALRTKRFTTTVGDLVSDAFREFESLRDELQDWYDNLPEQFQQGDKGSELEESISYLDNLSAPDVPSSLAEAEAVYIPAESISSRADRCDDSVSRLREAVDTLQSLEPEKDGEPEAKGEVQEEVSYDSGEIEDLVGELKNAISEAENVSFPGMY